MEEYIYKLYVEEYCKGCAFFTKCIHIPPQVEGKEWVFSERPSCPFGPDRFQDCKVK